jgi:PAS domain S-box-containing protein
MINACLDNNEVKTYEYSIMSDKGMIFFEGRIASLGDDKVLRFVRDITDKKTKDILIHKLSMAVEQSPVSIVITDLNSDIEYINHAFETSTGYERSEVLGRNTNILKSGKTDPIVYKTLWDNISKGENWSGEWINKRKNGTFYWENVSITPIHNEKGEITNYLAIKSDITKQKETERQILDLNNDLEQKITLRTSQLAEINTNLLTEIEERKQIEEELKHARIEAEQANIAKSEFLSRMSHELRTPMNSILGFAQLLQMGELSASQAKGITHIMRSGRHLLDLINEVLDISRIEAGRLSLSLEPVLVSGVIEETIDIVRQLAIERNVTINLENEGFSKLFIKSDHQRIKQVLINLLNNSIKYNVHGGNVDVKITPMPATKSNIIPIRISIKDTGQGINQDDLTKLFKPFERIGADKTTTEGTGLGLAVVEKLTVAMGGKIGVESEIGKGSIFWVEMPQCIGPIEIAGKRGELENTATQSYSKNGTILYIEDNISNIELIEQILEAQRSNIRLITNMTGRQTVQLALEYAPDLILLDLNLPDIHGSEVLENLQANPKTKNIPVVVVSADAMPQQLAKLLKSGARNYITKPLHIADFLKIVDEYISEKENKK